MRNVYEYADVAIGKLKMSISARFRNARNGLASFDSLNVITVKEETTSLYAALRQDNERIYREVAKRSYEDASDEAVEYGYSESDRERDIVALVLLNEKKYNAVTDYKYVNEIRRKQERLFESLVSSEDPVHRENAWNRATRLWFDQSRQYTDIMVDAGRIEAFRDAGVDQVEWVSQMDNRVCSDCRDLNGQIFDIDKVPDKPHPRCRCTIRPVRKQV